jgi:hypothetical protein
MYRQREFGDSSSRCTRCKRREARPNAAGGFHRWCITCVHAHERTNVRRRHRVRAAAQTLSPLCTQCGIRTPRAHLVGGFYRICAPCLTRVKRAHNLAIVCRRPRRCSMCRATFIAGRGDSGSTCSRACTREEARARKDRDKAAVIAALGGQCTCPGDPACWHVGACVVQELNVLTIDHTNRDGAVVRRRRRDGSLMLRAPSSWDRYRRALDVPNHGQVVRCFNCHNLSETRFRRDAASA